MKTDTQPYRDLRSAVFLRSILGWTAGGLAGIFGILAARALDLPGMPSAQITMGMVGLTGGFLHAFVIEAAGGTFRWKQGLMLAVIWALSLIGGATPLFLTSGLPLKMAVLTFYSFAAAAALGGTVTVYVMRSFSNRAQVDPAPGIFAWSIGFGLAAAAVDAIGGTLKTVLPPWFAWPAAFAVMALVLGSVSGYSALHFFCSKGNDRHPPKMPPRQGPGNSRESDQLYAGVLVLLLFPFYMNDFANIHVSDWRTWLFIDYVSSKLFPFLVILWAIRTKRIPTTEFGLRTQPPIPFMAVFIVAALVGIFFDQNGDSLLRNLPGYPALGSIPRIDDPCWNWIDMTAGLLMVGVFEEIVFRGYLCTVISRFTTHPGIIVGISALAFGLIHWSGGAHQVMITGVIGAVFMMLYLQTRSLPAIMLAHFAVNFVDYANLIPKEIFRFF